MKKITLITAIALVMIFTSYTFVSSTPSTIPTTNTEFVIEDELYIDDIPFDTEKVVDSLKAV